MAEALEGWSEVLAAVIKEAQDAGAIRAADAPKDLARFLIDSWEGAMLRAKVDKERAPLDLFLEFAFGKILVNADGPGIRADLDKIEAGRDHLVEVFLLKLRLAILRVVENLLNEPFDPRDIFTHDGAERSEEFGIVLSLRAQLDECLNGGERISDFVGKPPGDCFKRAETIRAVNQGFLLSKIFIEQGVVQGYSRILRQRKQQAQILL